MSNQIETIINVQLENRDRKTVFWRGILVVPAVVFIASFSSYVNQGWVTGMIILPVALALVFRGVYPSYVLSFNHAIIELETRLLAYATLLTDDYPSIERNPNVVVLFPDVENGRKLNRYLPLVKWILAIPLVIVGLAYALAALVATVFAWVSILASGKYPSWALEVVLGTTRFWNRVYGYALLMVTDEYPSFSLQ